MSELVAIRVTDRGRAVQAIESVWADGKAALVLDPGMPDKAATQMLERARAAALIHDIPDGSRTRMTRLDGGSSLPDGTASVVATSGSTGPPRLVVISRDAMDASAAASIARLGCAAGDRWLLVLPLHHVAGQQVLRRAALLGSPPDVPDGFTTEACTESTASHLALVPTMLSRVLDVSPDLSGRTVLLGGAGTPDALLASARASGARVVTSYGMTETAGGCVYDGIPLDGVEVDLDDSQRIRLRGPVLADGIINEGRLTPLTGDDGWLATNDLGSLDGGRLAVLGRADNLIITGGENVRAESVEDALRSHPLIDDAIVVGVADPDWGQRVVALVVAAAHGPVPTLAELRTHVGRELGRHAAPQGLVVVPELPRTTLGKPARAEALRIAADPTS